MLAMAMLDHNVVVLMLLGAVSWYERQVPHSQVHFR
jgi:hypothetical protein